MTQVAPADFSHSERPKLGKSSQMPKKAKKRIFFYCSFLTDASWKPILSSFVVLISTKEWPNIMTQVPPGQILQKAELQFFGLATKNRPKKCMFYLPNFLTGRSLGLILYIFLVLICI